MALSIGTLVGYLQLDDSNFNRKADNADRKLNALKLHLEALKRQNPKIAVEVDAQTAKIDELKAKIADLKAKAAEGVDVRVDIVEAMVELDRVQKKVRELHGKTIEIKVDERKAVSSLSNLTTAAAALGPALIPVTAAATGLIAALGAPVAAAAGGGGLYALIAGKAVQSTQKQTRAIDALKKKVDAAQQSLEAAQTPASKKSAAARLAVDTAAYQKALAKLNPEQQKFLKAQMSLKSAFTALESSAGTSIFGPLTQVMDLAAREMPKVAPVLQSVSNALGHLIHEAANSGAVDSMLKFLAAFSGPSIRAAGDILGNLAVGAGGLIKAFLPLSADLARGLESMSAGFASFGRGAGSNQGIQSFIAYVEQVGPKVVATLGDIVHALVHVGAALAPIGNISLGALDLLAKVITALPSGTITMLAGSFVLLATSLKALAIAGSIAAGFTKLQTAMKAEAVATFATKFGLLGTAVESVTARLAASKLALTSAGVGLTGLAVSAQSSNKWVQILGSSASGALLGFGVGGPIGAAIGAGAGALVGLGLAAFQAGTAVDAASKQVEASESVSMRAAAVNQNLSVGLHLTAFGAKSAGLSMKQFATYTNLALGAASKYNALTQYRAALANLTESVKENGATLDVNTRAGQANRDALSQIAQAAFQMASKMGDAAKRTEFLQRARGDFIRAAIAAGDTRVQAERLATQFHLLDLIHAQPSIVLKAQGVTRQLDAIWGVMDKIIGTHNAVLHYSTTGTPPKGLGGLLGGTPPTRKAAGGPVSGPGSGTSDSILARLSNGEFVVNAKSAARNRDLLEAINAQRYASGGTVRRSRQSRLSQAEKRLAYLNDLIAQAQQFGSAFAPNVFAAGLPTTKQVTTPGGVMTRLINGQVVTTHAAGTTRTVTLSTQEMLAQMLGYARKQKAQDARLAANVKKLRSEGVSKSLIAQMQAAGPQGIAQINALASGTKAQVRQFNALNAAAGRSLNEAGARAVAGERFGQLRKQAQQEQLLVKSIRKGLSGATLKVDHSKARVT